LDLRIKNYGCLKFLGEIWARWACAGANHQELTTCTKSRGQEEKKSSRKKGIESDRADLRPVDDGWSLVGVGPLTCGRWPLVASLSVTSGRWLVMAERPATDRWSLIVGRRSSGRRPTAGGPWPYQTLFHFNFF
jgi:hypothetical protein